MTTEELTAVLMFFARVAAAVASATLRRHSSGQLVLEAGAAYGCMTECSRIPGCLPPDMQWYWEE